MKHVPEDILKKLKAVIRRIEIASMLDGVETEDFNSATSVVKLAEISGMSERSLRDYFKAYTGESLVRYTSARRAEYAARIFRLFPAISKSEVARIVGFNCTNGIYGLMRKNGITDIDSLRNKEMPVCHELHYREEALRDSVMFYRQEEVRYEECSDKEFEQENWDEVERYVRVEFPKAQIVGYVGFAIDKYVVDDKDSGIFIAGILYQDISTCNLRTDIIGDIGWRCMPGRRYAVFSCKGPYDDLDDIYEKVLSTIRRSNNLIVDVSLPIMEKYLNSPADTSAEELITELWVPLRY